MLRMLKILSVLLKVLMLTRTAIMSSSKDQEDRIAQDIPVFELIDVRDYMSSNIESVQDHIDSETVKTEVGLQESTTPSPKGTPSEPTFPRAFVEFDNILNKKDIFVTFRWNKPEFTNRTIQKYRIQFVENLNRTIQSVNILPNAILQYKVYDLKPDTMYYFKVQAYNEFGAGPYTKFINVSTTHENPVPRLFINSYSGLHVLDIDLQIKFAINEYDIYKEIAYSALEHKIYGITEMGELVTSDFNPNAIETKLNYTKITKIDGPVCSLCIDWVARNLYWIQVSNQTNNIMKLDLTLWQSFGIVKYNIILSGTSETNFINLLPSTGYLYWMSSTSDKQYIIMQSDFEGKNMKPFLKNESNKCICPYKLTDLPSAMQIDNTNIDNPLMYWTTEDRLFAADIYGCGCNQILSAGIQINFDYLTIDKKNIYLYSVKEESIYFFKKKYALLESKKNAFEHVQKVNISLFSNLNIQQLTEEALSYFPHNNSYQLIALDKSLQPYPPTICLTPNMKDYHVEKVNITANSIVVSLPEPIPKDGCEKYNLATTIYIISVSYLTCLDNDLNKFEEFNVQTYERHYEIQNLTPFTEYTLKLALSNFYVDKLLMGLQYDAGVKLTTTPGKLNAPEDVTVQVLTSTIAAVYWMPPKKLNCVPVNYEGHLSQFNFLWRNSTQEKNVNISKTFNFTNHERTLDGKFFMIIQSLLPEKKTNIFVKVIPTNFNNLGTDSLTKTVYTEPNNLTLSGVSTDSMNISLISRVNLTIHTEFIYTLKYKKPGKREWQFANSTVNNDKITFYIKNLLPQTVYKFRLILRYPEHMRDPKHLCTPPEEFTFETFGIPGKPTVMRLLNLTCHLNWKPAQAHDSQVTYRLEGLIVANKYKEGNQTDKNEHWNLYYNGTDNYWIITRDMNQKYRFRVQAKNVYGFGEWSESSAVIDLTKCNEISDMNLTKYQLYNGYLPLILSLVGIFLICNVHYFYCSYRRRKKRKETDLCPTTDIESAPLNEIPSMNIQPNAPYALNPDEFVSTIIEKDQITLAKLLGSGAFGKVYQGTVKDFEGSETTPVAIKMLPKDASLQEKIKLFKEAKLMSGFRHEHVLSLLGICLDPDSPWLILELMEVDLLKYLEKRRTLKPSDPHALRLKDLLAMCEDVARGCCYLEEQHFVHRDLACRNCLISARNRENPIVKISDFGLARDIYENDYYRMEGGSRKLPVRWMAPESLMNRIFTSQSDVWAFGVVMWEITSLGQTPYASIDSRDISNYVCAGNKLLKPLKCPQTLYELMLRCWNAVNNRPNFIFCLEKIENLKIDIEIAMLILEISEYVQMN